MKLKNQMKYIFANVTICSGFSPPNTIAHLAVCYCVWWRRRGSNSRPYGCEPYALPAELRPQIVHLVDFFELALCSLSGAPSCFTDSPLSRVVRIAGPFAFWGVCCNKEPGCEPHRGKNPHGSQSAQLCCFPRLLLCLFCQ